LHPLEVDLYAKLPLLLGDQAAQLAGKLHLGPLDRVSGGRIPDLIKDEMKEENEKCGK
jgi:predicted neutral ceramidase superfamily lipid hydrolase